MLLIGALVFVIVAVIGIVLALLFVSMVILLISGGIISASVLVGLQQKSVSKGFKAFLLSVSIVGSTIVSVVFFLFINTVAEWKQLNGSILGGVAFGIGSGWVLGLVMFAAAKKLVLFLKSKYNHKMIN
ncbi:hypothetical protein [Chitinophaga qingshengii]|uniref:Uncharacterized protein n=1 Tax=Chitinophaga qingshengii TaxID=1569794 RepID=A0ABR7THJ6_9BACT|nr:hypothetical protein [Chitinophaga qingshengii]MBC9929977.1 hypothetical protein [Chitinophaga qingshengii]